MDKIVKSIHPHHLKKIDTVKKLLLIYKNILIEMYHKGYVEKIDGVDLPIIWSNSKNAFVISEDEIDINNIEIKLFYNEHLIKGGKKLLELTNQKSFFEYAKNFNLNKNKNRILLFKFIDHKTNIIEYERECIYLTGLYLKKEDKVYVPIDTTKSFNDNFCKEFDFITPNNSGKIKESYYDVYNQFLQYCNNEELEITIDNQKHKFNIEDFINLNPSFNEQHKIKKRKISDTSINLYKNIINNNSNLNLINFNKIKNGFLSTHLNLLFGNFLKSKLNISGEGIIINSGFFERQNVKITGDFIFKIRPPTRKENNKIENYNPILPFKF